MPEKKEVEENIPKQVFLFFWSQFLMKLEAQPGSYSIIPHPRKEMQLHILRSSQLNTKNASSRTECCHLQKLTIADSCSSSPSSHVHGRDQGPSVVLRVVTLHTVEAVPWFRSSDYVEVPPQLTHCRLMSPWKQTYGVAAMRWQERTSTHFFLVLTALQTYGCSGEHSLSKILLQDQTRHSSSVPFGHKDLNHQQCRVFHWGHTLLRVQKRTLSKLINE